MNAPKIIIENPIPYHANFNNSQVKKFKKKLGERN